MTRRLLVLALALAVCAFASAPRGAYASIAIDYSLDSGVTWTNLVTSGTSAGPISTGVSTVTVGNFDIVDASASSDSPGAPSGAQLLSATLSIKNTSGTAQTIWLAMGAQDFTAPVTPPDIIMNSHIGGSVVGTSSDNSLSFTSYVNTNNGLAEAAFTGTPIIAGPGTPNVTSGSFLDDKYATITSLSGPYAIAQKLELTLGAGRTLNYGANTTLTPVPEPSTMAIAGLGALGLIGYGLRRRRA